MKRIILLFGLLVLSFLILSCKSNPTTPSKPAATISSVAVTSTRSTILVGETEQMTATVTMSDGSTKPGVGTWSSDATAQATVNQSGLVAGATAGDADIIFNNTAGGQGVKRLTVRNIWSRSGVGDNVFDMPTYVSRVRITAMYTHYTSNFIVYIAGQLIVNELIGTGWGTTTFDGTYATSGGTVEIQYSSGVSWSFTEVPVSTALSIPNLMRPNFMGQPGSSGSREFEIYKRTAEKMR